MEKRIVWHTAHDIPNGKDKYLVKRKINNRAVYNCVTTSDFATTIRRQDLNGIIEKWAYLKDLESEQPNRIDWEQRRYEIAKDMLCAIFVDEGNEKRSTDPGIEFEYQSLEGSAHSAVRYADALINELKKHDNG